MADTSEKGNPIEQVKRTTEITRLPSLTPVQLRFLALRSEMTDESTAGILSQLGVNPESQPKSGDQTPPLTA